MQLELDFQALLLFIHMMSIQGGNMVTILVQMVELILMDTIFLNKSVD